MSEFVKAATTKVAASASQSEIITVLARYGASGFGFRTRGAVVEATFHLPRPTGDDVTVRVPVDVSVVLEKLLAYHHSPSRTAHTKTPDREQAERVAWRALLVWIEASLLAVQLGAQSMEEAFFAHLVVATSEGERRLVEYVGELSVASGGRLPAPTTRMLPSQSEIR